ncbi:hypothetical protein [Botrimarina mediterranea]|nr:hypothetical protein [Botrimarina mediterranea]
MAVACSPLVGWGAAPPVSDLKASRLSFMILVSVAEHRWSNYPATEWL